MVLGVLVQVLIVTLAILLVMVPKLVLAHHPAVLLNLNLVVVELGVPMAQFVVLGGLVVIVLTALHVRLLPLVPKPPLSAQEVLALVLPLKNVLVQGLQMV